MKFAVLGFAILLSQPSVECLGQPRVLTEREADRIDSLKKTLAGANSKKRFESLSAIAFAFQNRDSAIHYANMSIDYALLEADSMRIVEAINVKASILREQGKLVLAATLFESDLRMARRIHYDLMEKFLLNNMAMTYTSMGQYDKALDCHLLSLGIREKLKDLNGIRVTLNNIGVIYEEMEDFDLALDYYRRALKVINETSSKWQLEHQLANIGCVLIKLGRVDEAEAIADKISGSCKSKECEFFEIEAMNNLYGLVHFNKSDFRKAEVYFRMALDNSLRSGVGGNVLEERAALNSHWLANTLFQAGDISNSLGYLDKSQQMAQASGYGRIALDNTLLYSKIYAVKGNFKRALEFQQRHDALASKIMNGKLLNKIARLQAEIEERENTAKLITQGKILELQDLTLQRQSVLNALVGVVALLTIGLTVALFRSNRQKNRINQLLDQRIRERTCELENNRDQLKHASDHQAILFSKLSTELCSIAATLRGLTQTSKKDLPEEHAAYFKQAELVAEKLVEYVNQHSDRGE